MTLNRSLPAHHPFRSGEARRRGQQLGTPLVPDRCSDFRPGKMDRKVAQEGQNSGMMQKKV